MSLKQILVPILSLREDESALRAAVSLAEKFGAHVSVLTLHVALASSYAEQQQPLSEILADIALGPHSSAARERERILAWLKDSPHAFEPRTEEIEIALGRDGVVAHARMADLIVAARAPTHQKARRELIEDILFKSGRPLLLAPETLPAVWSAERVLVCWNASVEATRAVAGAMSLLKAAAQVRVVTVDAAPSLTGHGPAPGRELAAYLASHDVRAELHNLDSLGASHAHAIQAAALDFNADLIVMGAYGRSRAREFILGGVTREMLGAGRVPVLLAH